MLDTWDIEAQQGRTVARALVTVFSDARALLESVIEDELVGNRTHASSDTDLILPTSLGRPHFAALRGGK